MKKIVIWGAGKKGIGISEKLRKTDILYFCDNNIDKIGNYINGYKVESADRLYKENIDEIVLVSTIPLDDSGMKKIIESWKGEVYFYEDYFMIPEIIKQMDSDLLSEYYMDYRIKDNIYGISRENWFREDIYSDINCRLIRSMKEGDTNSVNELMENAYNAGIKYFDEYIDMRPGMRLIYNIICKESDKGARVVDLACGHGELIQKLAQDGYSAYAVDFSGDRLKNLVDVETTVGDVKKTLYDDAYFDIVICMECMEHMDDVIELADELIRITQKNGLIFVTVTSFQQDS